MWRKILLRSEKTSMNGNFRHRWIAIACIVVAVGTPPAGWPGVRVLAAARCQLTQGNGIDPDYIPNAPLRSRVGTGFILTGVVRSGIDCSPIAGARVEFWLRNPNGQYDALHRGIAVTDGSGRYRIESNFPGGGGFGPHIHLRVAVSGYRPLVTIFFPRAGTTAGVYDIVLEPEM